MNQKLKNQALLLYLLLTGVFISLFILSNLIFLKFFQVEVTANFTMILSVGLIPYPLTFLVTDIVSEIYGQKKANMIVKIGLVCALLVMGLTMIADYIPAMTNSAVRHWIKGKSDKDCAKDGIWVELDKHGDTIKTKIYDHGELIIER